MVRILRGKIFVIKSSATAGFRTIRMDLHPYVFKLLIYTKLGRRVGIEFVRISINNVINVINGTKASLSTSNIG